MVLGTFCCILSALAYTAANVCQRKLAVDYHPAWITFVKVSVAVVVLGPWLAYRSGTGRPAFPPRRALAALIPVALVGQLVGNLGILWAFRVIGMAPTVPALYGVMLIGSALLGRLVLGEKVSRRSAAAIGLLIGSIAILGVGAGAANRAMASAAEVPTGPIQTALAVAAACLAGVAFALVTTTVRHTVTSGHPASGVVFVITSVGTLVMGSLSIWRVGIPELISTRPGDFAIMLAAGGFNLLAFLMIAKGLQLTTLVHANVLNASQVAMCAVAGMFLFLEPASTALLLGVCLTVAGTILIDRPDGGHG